MRYDDTTSNSGIHQMSYNCCDHSSDNNDQSYFSNEKSTQTPTRNDEREGAHGLDTFDGRYKTFEKWPKVLQHLVYDLCTSGFYYLQVGDRVQCYNCNGLVHEWELNDCPFGEHAKWFPQCTHINNIRDSNFVKSSQQQNVADIWI